LGLEAVDPAEGELPALVEEWTEGVGADVAFEVSGSRAGAAVIPLLMRTRGQIVIVAIFSHTPEMNLHRFFWRELKLRGARVYEPEDFERAIELAASGALPLESLITARWPLEQLQRAFETLETSSDQMKVLIDTRGE
jgi:threonine dehydrogenase-like Zn-dependent dehydrogenase